MSAFSSFHRIKVEHPKNWWPQLPGMTIFFCCTRHILICLSLQCTAVRWYFECHQLGLCTITNYYYPVKCKDNRASWQWAGAETDYRSFILIFCILWTSDDVWLYVFQRLFWTCLLLSSVLKYNKNVSNCTFFVFVWERCAASNRYIYMVPHLGTFFSTPKCIKLERVVAP